MHYKNGREAKEGDFVVGKIIAFGREKLAVAGRIEQLNPGCESCNAVLVTPTLGSVGKFSVTVGELIHAEDAFDAADNADADPGGA